MKIKAEILDYQLSYITQKDAFTQGISKNFEVL